MSTNAKTHDEIKKGLECCFSDADCEVPIRCPYAFEKGSCDNLMMFNALAYIQQLEADNAQQARCIENLTDKLNATNDALPRWISVEERLPDGFETVLIMRDDIKQACFGWLIGGNWSVPKGVRVTHWMPLPEPSVEE